MKQDQPEFRFTVWVADLLRKTARPEMRNCWSHFPAGEKRSAMTGARLKRMGSQRGWADFIFVLPPNGRAAFLELKIPGRYLTPEQRDFRDAMVQAGAFYAVARTGDEVIEILSEWNVIRPFALPLEARAA